MSTMRMDLYYHELIGREKIVGYFNRPQDWIDVPTVLPAEQKIAGLYAIYEDDVKNHAAFTLTLNAASATYYVDWGDGVVSTGITSGTQANHSFTYSTSSGPLTTRGYRQGKIIAAVETSGNGDYITIIDLSSKHPSNTVSANHWMDMSFGPNTITRLRCGNASNGMTQPILEHIYWYTQSSSAGTTLEDMMYGCSSFLQFSPNDSPVLNTSNTTNMKKMFYGCSNMSSAPLFSTDSVTLSESMFQNCTRLQEAPVFNYSKLVSSAGSLTGGVTSMYSGCVALRYFATPTSANQFTSTNKSFYRMFYNCSSLVDPPSIRFDDGETLREVFYGCSKLSYVGNYNFGKATNLTAIFQNCTSLVNTDGLSGGQYTTAWDNAFNSTAITGLPTTFFCNRATSMQSTFFNIHTNLSLPDNFVPYLVNAASATNVTFTSGSTTATSSSLFGSVYQSFDVISSMVPSGTYVETKVNANTIILSKAATASSTTETVYFNGSFCTGFNSMFAFGSTANTKAITALPDTWNFNIATAANLGSMFQMNTQLKCGPKFNTRFATQAYQMFYYCYGLKYLPGGEGVGVAGINMPPTAYDFSYCTSLTFTFGYCTSLVVLPDVNLVGATNIGSFCSNCSSLKVVPNPIRVAPNVSTVTSLFSNSGITAIPSFSSSGLAGISGGVTCSSMFQSCTSLSGDISSYHIPFQPINSSSMFLSCTGITHAPSIDLSYVTNMTNMFSNCSNLLNIPVYNVQACTNFTGVFSTCNVLTEGRMNGTRRSITYPGSSNLSSTKLNDIFTGLENLNLTTPALSGQGITITFTGAAGAATCDKTIATNKGWITVPA